MGASYLIFADDETKVAIHLANGETTPYYEFGCLVLSAIQLNFFDGKIHFKEACDMLEELKEINIPFYSLNDEKEKFMVDAYAEVVGTLCASFGPIYEFDAETDTLFDREEEELAGELEDHPMSNKEVVQIIAKSGAERHPPN